jgi:hypothetical protein
MKLTSSQSAARPVHHRDAAKAIRTSEAAFSATRSAQGGTLIARGVMLVEERKEVQGTADAERKEVRATADAERSRRKSRVSKVDPSRSLARRREWSKPQVRWIGGGRF